MNARRLDRCLFGAGKSNARPGHKFRNESGINSIASDACSTESFIMQLFKSNTFLLGYYYAADPKVNVNDMNPLLSSDISASFKKKNTFFVNYHCKYAIYNRNICRRRQRILESVNITVLAFIPSLS